MLRPRLLVYLSDQRSEKFELSALGCSLPPTVVGRPAIVRAVISADQPRIIIDFISPSASAVRPLPARLVPRGARQRSSIVRSPPLSFSLARRPSLGPSSLPSTARESKVLHTSSLICMGSNHCRVISRRDSLPHVYKASKFWTCLS